MLLENIHSPEDVKALPLKDLEKLSSEIREFLIETVSKTGGHLASNLGVVELTLALHRIFDLPRDTLIWDVGHQCYVHKMLTGRRERFSVLRQKGGLKGFPDPKESIYDAAHAGHSSTSLSIAAGIARAKRLDGDTSETIVVIGDGAFTAGMVYEALNQIAYESLPVIIILNDNGMSISQNVGGIAAYFEKLFYTSAYFRVKKIVERIKRRWKWTGWIIGFLYHAKEWLRRGVWKLLGKKRNFFEDLDICYYGPLDGHNLKLLLKTMEGVKGLDKPVLLHVRTVKGKDHTPSEENPERYHGISAPKACIAGEIITEGKSFSEVFGETMVHLAACEPRLFAITAAMESGTGLSQFASLYPERFADVGIAEQHAVTFAFGLSLRGYIPVVAIYSTFLQRGFDQLVHDIGISGAHVVFALDRAGLVPGDGETHQGIFDIAYLSMIPGMTILAPATGKELQLMLEYAVRNVKGPVAIRYPKEVAHEINGYDPNNYPLDGNPVLCKEKGEILLVAVGTMLHTAFEVARELESRGKSIAILNLRFVKPINTIAYEILSRFEKVYVLEEGIIRGGVGEYLRAKAGDHVQVIGVEDFYPEVGSRGELLEVVGLTKEKIIAIIEKEERRVV
ncbi:1-deoxy-D-xylulose-5-phosphate synthase [Thermospira aquatica]|uniref:1-deoxy-D-xylulose-5-phosphate synthase n=1 Tax=Thermospira aquatica TaxID=2828656 RepID=A0AAX3BCL5_9SPIR|nr:1-deoxy-D-xylulose-5-phosphate synthase [Thermospira aquatica]URA10052.1 1-deoxy-D-xylulose-5-phosphate synthase [Thermospira aquatica]